MSRLKTKVIGSVQALLKSDAHIANKDLIENTEYFRFRLHVANVRLRELGESYTSKHFKVKDGKCIKEAIGIIKKEDLELFKRISFFDNEELASEALKKALNKNENSILVTVPVMTNVPKSEQKTGEGLRHE